MMATLLACVGALAYLTLVGAGVLVWVRETGLLERFSVPLAAATGLLLLTLATYYLWHPAPFGRLVASIGVLSLVSLMIWWLTVRHRPAMGRWPAACRVFAIDLLPYAAVFLAAYAFFSFILVWDLSRNELPVASIMNSDIFLYVTMANTLQSLVPAGNISGLDMAGFIRHDVTAAFVTLALTSILAFQPALEINLPLLATFAALTVVGAYWIIRSAFNLPFVASGLIAIQVFATPLFMHVLFSYFLSQTMHGALLVAALGGVLFHRTTASYSREILARSIVPVVFGGCIIFTYGTLYYSDMALLLLAIAAAAISGRPVTPRNVIRAITVASASIAIAVVANYLMSPERSLMVYQRAIYQLTAPVGYHLPLVSLLSLAGFPVSFGEPGPMPPGYWGAPRPLWDEVGALCAQALAITLALVMLTRDGRSIPRLFLIALFFGLQIAYLAVWLKMGASYQQWKFASIYPLLVGFSFLATCYAAIRGALGRSRVLGASLNVALVVLLVLNVAVAARVWHGNVMKFTSDFRSLAAIDDMDEVNRVAVWFNDIYADHIAPMFINRKPIDLAGPTSFGPGKTDKFEPGTWFLTKRSAACAPSDARDIGSGFTLSRSPPFELPPQQRITFAGEASRCIDLSGFRPPESWGSWTEGRQARISFFCACNAARPQYLVFNAIPYRGKQRASFSVNGVPVGEQTIEGTEPVEVRVPLAPVQSFAERIRVDITLPDAEAAAKQGGADTRALGLGLVEMRLE